MYYVYIIQSIPHGSYYTGSCKDITVRLKQHNTGKVRSTASGKPWKLIYQEHCDTLPQARKREQQIKHWKSRKAIERLLRNK